MNSRSHKLGKIFVLGCILAVFSSVLWGASKRPPMSLEQMRASGLIDATYLSTSPEFQRRERNVEYNLRERLTSLKRDAINADSGNIAVLEDDGSIISPTNLFDLDNSNILFTPSGSGYRVSKIAKNFDPATGSILVPGAEPQTHLLDDDDASQVAFSGGFTFTFFGQTYTSVWVNSDGDLTFNQGDATSDDRDVFRFLTRQPRIAPLFVDLLPPCGGSVSTLQRSDRFIVLWNDVPNFSQNCTSTARNHNTFEVILHSDGSIEFSFNGIQSSQAVVGVAPGNNQGTPPSVVDYDTLTSPTVEPGAIEEFFTPQSVFSNSAVTKRFYQSHGDNYDYIAVFANFPVDLGGNAFAFEVNVSNSATGLGSLSSGSPFNNGQFWGSGGRLQSYLNMGSLANYPSDPNQIFLGTNSTVEVMGQEFGHRWMAFVDIPGATCKDPTFINTILGRDCAHWSFFFNSHGSVMEGNDIVDNGSSANPRFQTTTNATTVYSDLDQYIMGFRDPGEVQNTFVVFSPTGTSRRNGSAPAANVSFNGTRHDVTIQDIINANGLRTPTPATSQKSFRQAWILLVQKGTTPSTADLSKVDTIRQAWQSFFSTATNGRGSVDTTLVPSRFSASISPNNGFAGTTAGQGALSVSYGQVASSTTPPPVALAIFGLTQNNTLVTEAGIPAATPTTSTRIFVDYDAASGRDSGVALVNPSGNPLTVDVTLTNQAGQSAKSGHPDASGCPSITLPANGHLARFVSQLGCTSLGNSFLGSLTLTSTSSFAAVNLRAARNAHDEQIFSALPVVDLTQAPVTSGNLIFSQVVDGGGNPTQILLMNTTGSAIAGTVSLFDDSGNPIQLDFGGGPQSSFPYSIVANGVQKFSTNGSGSLKVGYAVVTSTSGALPAGALVFSQNNNSGGLASQAGVLNAPQTTFARLYIERASAPLKRNTGIALVNRNSSAATVNVNLASLDNSISLSTTLNVPANGHLARFIDELMSGVPADFKGMLTLTSNVPIAPVTLRLTNNQRGEVLFSTLPVADLNHPPSGQQILSQIVDGGSYTTQIILINVTSGGQTITINFFNDNGNTVSVPFN